MKNGDVFVKKYIIENSELMNEWDKENNQKNGYNPQEISYGSHSKVSWICSKCGHKWNSVVKDRVDGHGCPECAKKNRIVTRLKKAVEKEGSFFENYPELMEEWDYKKNKEFNPKELTSFSKTKVWWKCKKCVNEWKTSIANRASQNTKCPKCANINRGQSNIDNKLANKGSLLDNYPDLIEEWNIKKNLILPSSVLAGTHKKYWWKCSICGNEWQASVHHRVRGSGCPKCYRRNQTSFPEQVLYYYIKKKYRKAINKYTDIFDNGMELDIFIPERNIGIEYDGYIWHRNKKSNERERIKYDYCKNNNILLIRIKEKRNEEHKINNKNCDYMIITDYNNKNNYESLNTMLQNVFEILKIDLITNVEKDSKKIKTSYYTIIKDDNLYSSNPTICEEWNYDKNNGLTPDMFKSNSNEKVWWKCKKCGYEWEANIANRNKGTICPVCAKEKKSNSLKSNWQKRIDKMIQEKGSLKDNYPKLIKEWDYKKNTVNPENVTVNSHKRVFWICSKCGYNWATEIRLRAEKKHSCPKCKNKII